MFPVHEQTELVADREHAIVLRPNVRTFFRVFSHEAALNSSDPTNKLATSLTLVHAAQPGHGFRHGGGGGNHREGTTTANVPTERDFAAGHRRDQRWGLERYESTHHLPLPNASCGPGSRPEWATDTAASGHSRRRQTPASLWLRSRLPGAALLPAARWQGCGCLARTRCFWSPCLRTTVRATSTR